MVLNRLLARPASDADEQRREGETAPYTNGEGLLEGPALRLSMGMR